MKIHTKKFLVGGSLLFAIVGLALPQETAAIVGAPATPVSVAGVARRTTRRAVAAGAATASAASAASASAAQASAAQASAAAAQASAASAQASATKAAAPAGAPAVGSVVASLPAGCTAVTKDGVEYQNCGGVYYRAAFQGNNLVYVVAQP
jgi:hypothetical protein